MSRGALFLLVGLAGVALLWKYSSSTSGGGSPIAFGGGPDNVNASGTGSASDPTSSGLNDQSGSYSTGFQV